MLERLALQQPALRYLKSSSTLAARRATWLATFVAMLLSTQALAQVPGVEHVVIIGVDGMSPDGVQKAHTPVMNRLIEGGAYSMHARAVLPSSSSPNWASMIMGAGPVQHGITSNDWRQNQYVLPSSAYASDGFFPTIFHTLRSQRPDARIAVIYDWGGFGNLFGHESVDHALSPEGPEATTAEAVRIIKAERPTLTFVHLDHVDGAGHRDGHGSAAYYDSVERADRLIGELVDAVEAAGIASTTLILVTADHGGYGTGHGGQTLDEVEIPWIVYGPGVVPGGLSIPITTFDTAATVAWALGLDAPEGWIARPVKQAFSDKRPQTGSYVPGVRIGTLGGLFVDELPRVELTVDGSYRIRYTTNGDDPTLSSPSYEEPVRLTGPALFKARAFANDGTAGPVSSERYRLVMSSSGHGLSYAYFEGAGWEELPHFGSLESLKSGRVYEVTLAGIDHRSDQFAVELEGQLQISTPGSYTFYLQSDDGAKLFLNGDMVVDNDGSHGPQIRIGRRDLAVGSHPIRVEYFNNGGGATLRLFYEGPGVERQIIPPEVLVPASGVDG